MSWHDIFLDKSQAKYFYPSIKLFDWTGQKNTRLWRVFKDHNPISIYANDLLVVRKSSRCRFSFLIPGF
jgi:hypothetical protein